MANAGLTAGTAGSQFFIVTGDGERRPHAADYACLGTVTSGLDVAQKISDLVPASGDGTAHREGHDRQKRRRSPTAPATTAHHDDGRTLGRLDAKVRFA